MKDVLRQIESLRVQNRRLLAKVLSNIGKKTELQRSLKKRK